MRLYEIAGQYRQLCDLIETAEGGEAPDELDNSIAESLIGLSDSLEHKSRSIVSLIRELVLQADGIAEESKRLATLAKVKRNAADRLKTYLLECCLTAEIAAMDLGIAKLRVQKATRPSISWDRDDPIPEEFQRWTVSL